MPKDCSSLYQLKVNDQTYEVKLQISQNEEEKKLQLINCVVTVKLNDDYRNIESTVEGYVIHENIEK